MTAAASLMDQVYRHQRHIYDLTRKPYLLGRDRLIAGLRPPPSGSVLEIGCGTGRNLIRAARRYGDAQFFGVDVSALMLATARQSVRRAGLDGRIALAQADAATLDPETLFGRRVFDRVFISYAISMIGPWRQVLASAVNLLNEGGSLHLVDFGDQRHLPRWFRALLFRWLDLFHVTPRTDIAAELAALAAREPIAWRLTPLLRGYAFHADIERQPAGEHTR